jgi:PLAT/LH2 domain
MPCIKSSSSMPLPAWCRVRQCGDASPCACLPQGAGTSARVYVELFGDERGGKSSGEQQLLQPQRGAKAVQEPFQRGATDTFDVSCADLGSPTRVRVWHDNHGHSPSWFLQEVRVRRKVGGTPTDGQTAAPMHRWTNAWTNRRRNLTEARPRAKTRAQFAIVAPKPPENLTAIFKVPAPRSRVVQWTV